jgi:hypothetical protein
MSLSVINILLWHCPIRMILFYYSILWSRDKKPQNTTYLLEYRYKKLSKSVEWISLVFVKNSAKEFIYYRAGKLFSSKNKVMYPLFASIPNANHLKNLHCFSKNFLFDSKPAGTDF